MYRAIFAASLAVITACGGALAQTTPFETRYDPAIPDSRAAFGYGFGEEITPPEDAIDYLYTLEAAAPDRVEVVEYARSWEGRPLAYAVIASPDTLARVDEIQSGLASLADPRGLDAASRASLIAELPAVVWLSYGVHGNEISSTDAGLRTAYHLLAAQDDPIVETIFENTIVVVDPTQNPDGRNRFIQSFRAARGLESSADRYTAEHDEPWPGGRYNHYLFDLNRDWFARTQPETRGRTQAILDWRPVVVVDAHEMSGDSTYFFAPSAEPFNPEIVQSQRDAQELIGRNHGNWFDRLGYAFFTREVYDAFYPGYGDMWPTLQGAVAMTYEQGSARGLEWRRRDGSLLTYGDGVDHHFVASISTAQVVAENRERFLSDFVAFRDSAASSSTDPQAMMLSLSGNRWGAERMARNLAAQGIEVGRVAPGVSACGARFEEGGFLVRFDQPAGRLARTLLVPTTDLPADFMAEQERRRAEGLGHELYDVTAWSLPLMSNVDATSCRRTPPISTEAVEPEAPIERVTTDHSADWGYVIPWTDAGQARLVAALGREGVMMRTSDLAFRIGDRRFPRGSVVIPRHGAPEDLDALISRLAAESGAHFEGMESSWVDEGPNPGSGNFLTLRAPSVAMLWDEGTDPTSAGATRYVLERRYDIPVSVIRTGSVSRAQLDNYDVLIIPEQGWTGLSGALGSSGTAAIRTYVRGGGILVGLGDATRWLADSDTGLIPAQRERAADAPRDASAGSGEIVDGTVLANEGELQVLEAEAGALPESSPGALVNVEANTNAWMSAGYTDGAAALVMGSDIYAPVSMGDATTALRFAAREELLAGGYLWEEYADQLALKPFVLSTRQGAGQVVAITQSPTTRAYLEGLDLLLLNAVLLGPAHSRALR
ncbi:M14 family metallopeptidase [uncultured Maricaulis sp.]|uniref:M14 family metallopeptidase n=1 Tax=uncultured Maricaulis sp. TaxID=174710 RepID=UPI00262736B3|nr:M14 family metallopeptidase [uncultured Maricaulis sp.]